jgi:hypothetical protein
MLYSLMPFARKSTDRKALHKINPWRQFHQTFTSANALALTFYFINNTTPKFTDTDIEVTPNFYALHSLHFARKMSANLLTQILLIQ